MEWDTAGGVGSEKRRALGTTREISGCAIDWRAGDGNAQPTPPLVD